MYAQKYRWFDNFYLHALVAPGGKQKLRITLEDAGKIKDRAEIECIHTAVTDISAEKVDEYHHKDLEITDIINAKSLENAQEIKLAPEECFKAFKSWVAGIVDMGLDALYIQTQIESLAKFSYPIAQKLLQFVAKHNKDALYYFIDYIARNCIINGVVHKSSMIANLDILKPILTSQNSRHKERLIEYLVTTGFPDSILMELLPNHKSLIIKQVVNTTDLSELMVNILEQSEDVKVIIAGIEDAPNYNTYRVLFNENNARILCKVAANPNAVRFEEYGNLFNDKRPDVRKFVASNPNAVFFEKYKSDLLEDNWLIRRAISCNPNVVDFIKAKLIFPPEFGKNKKKIASFREACQYKEYRRFFEDQSISVRSAVAGNPEATRFKEYSTLFEDKNDDVRISVVKNPNAVSFKEYKKFLTDREWSVRRAVSLNPNVADFIKAKLVFPPEFGDDRFKIASNPEACQYKEYQFFFKDKSWKVRRAVAGNPAARELSEFKTLIPNELIKKIKTSVKNGKNSDYDDKNRSSSVNPKLLKKIAQEPRFTEYDEFRFLFKHDYWYVRAAIAENKSATRFPEYTDLFFDTSKNVKLTLCKQEHAAAFDEFENFLKDEDWDIRRAAVRNPLSRRFDEFANLFPESFGTSAEEIAALPEAVEYEEYKLLFKFDDLTILQNIAGNVAAPKLNEYRQLFKIYSDKMKVEIAMNENAVRFNEFGELITKYRGEPRSEALRNPNIARYENLHEAIAEVVAKFHSITAKKEFLRYCVHRLPNKKSVFSANYHIWRAKIHGHDLHGYLKELKLSELNRLCLESNIDGHFTKYIQQEICREKLTIIPYFKKFKKVLPEVLNTYGLCRELEYEPSDMYKNLTPKVCTTPPYIVKKIPKRRGGKRTLNIPYGNIKRIQKWILENILINVKPHDCAHGFIPGRSIKTNAEPHVGKSLIIKMDLKDFFPSIKQWRITQIFLSLGYSYEFSLILSHLCTVCKFFVEAHSRYSSDSQIYIPTSYRFLPQGGPTSPYLSNLAFYEVDDELTALCNKLGVIYTRYADDLTFSTDITSKNEFVISNFIRNVFKIVYKHGFSINKKKTKVLRPHMQQRVCGIVVNSAVHIPRKYHNRIRGMLHRAENYGFNSVDEIMEYKSRLKGMLAYVKSIQPSKSEQYLKRFQEIQWFITSEKIQN